MTTEHQCEPWQILVDDEGRRRYCGACGKTDARDDYVTKYPKGTK